MAETSTPEGRGPISLTLSTDQLRSLVDAGDVDTVMVAFTDHYGRLMGKRFDVEFFVDEV